MRVVAALSLVGALALAPLASAAPSAAPLTGSGADAVVTTASGSYYLSALATTPTGGGAAEFRILLMSMDGTGEHRYSGVLPAGALVRSGQVVTLKTRLAGLPMQITWRLASGTQTVEMGHHDYDGTTARGWTIEGGGGTAELRLGGVVCTTSSVASGSAFAYSTDGSAYGDALTTRLPMSLKGARCATPASEPVPPPLP